MGFSGRLEGIAPSDILQIISQNRMTGTLIARCPDTTAMVVFKEGQVMEATSDAPQESLGHLLVAQGLMSEGTIEAARERLKQEPDRSLGAILVQMGALNEKTLETVVFRQIGHIVHQLMSCDDGFITFDRGESAVKRKLNTREFFLPSGVSAEYLIMERARVVDEERRRGSDRRAHPRGPLQEDEPAQEAPPNAVEQGRAGAAVHTITAWFRGIRLPKMGGLRSAVASAVGKGKAFAATAVKKGGQIAASAGGWIRRTTGPWFQRVLARTRAFSPDGRALIYAGAVGTAAGIALILFFTLSFQTSGGDLMITGRVVKLRAKPTTSANVVTKIPRGETVSQVEFKDGWHQVRTRTGETGWVWNTLVEQQMKKGWAFNYRVTGSEVLLLAGLVLLAMGIMRRRSISSAPPRVLREVK